MNEYSWFCKSWITYWSAVVDGVGLGAEAGPRITVTPAWSSSGEKDPKVLGNALAGLRQHHVAVGHIARDAAVGPLRPAKEITSSPLGIVADQRIAAEVGQASRAREVQEVLAIRQAVEHLERRLFVAGS